MLVSFACPSWQTRASEQLPPRFADRGLGGPQSVSCSDPDLLHGVCPASSLGRDTILDCDLQVTSSPEASPSLEGEVVPCPRDAVTSFPRVFLSEDCASNQDGDAAHYKLVRQRLCAPGPRQAVWEPGQSPAAPDSRAVASEKSRPTGFVCPKGHRRTDTLLRLPPLPLLQQLCHAQTMSFINIPAASKSIKAASITVTGIY